MWVSNIVCLAWVRMEHRPVPYLSLAVTISKYFSQVHGHHPPPEASPLLHLYKGGDCPHLERGNLTGFSPVLLQRDQILLPQDRVHGGLARRLRRNPSTEVRAQD